MKQTLALALLAVANAMDLNTYKYMKYISEFNKSPASVEEFNMRMRNFVASDSFIEEWNADPTNTHRVGHNFLSDWTAEEKSKLTQLGKGTTFENPRKDVPLHKVEANQAIPTTWNWTAQGVVPNVGNQASCGDCYAWSAIGAVEASLAIQHNGTNPTGAYTGNYFSVQQPTSCSSAFGNNGCNGGWYYWVWEYMQTSPVVQAIYYPFSSSTGVTGTCATITNATAPFAQTITTGTPYVQVGRTNTDIQSAIMVKPVSVAVEANLPAF